MPGPTALVVGGTGPTGPFVVNGLRERGYTVSILHRGTHEVPEIPADVEHIHTDPYALEATAEALGDRTFDVAVVMYGRLRMLAELLDGRVARFLSVGGAPAYLGFMDPTALSPAGMRAPVREDAPLVSEGARSRKSFAIVRTEEAVFRFHPRAAHFRYPYVYGPNQPLPREWCIVRRMRDRRPFIVVPDDGLTLCTFAYMENCARAILLAVDHADASAGQIYNVGDEQVLTLRQVIEVIGRALDWQGEIVSMPWELAKPARPMIMQPMTTHRMLDISKLQRDLGYRDAVAAEEALARTARWLLENPPKPGGPEEMVLEDPFDYPAEDRLVASWREALAKLPDPGFDVEPGLTMSYAGPGPDPE